MTERLKVIPTLPGMGRSLVHHDERSKNFRAVDRVNALAEPRTRTWRRGFPYDQGTTSTCVAQTGKGILNTLPMSSLVSYSTRSKYDIDPIYNGAKQRDEWPGEDYEGTSGLGLCKYFLDTGLIKEYRWCFGLQDVLLTLSHLGPVGLGVWWKSNMFETDDLGFISATGPNMGGHEVELIGNNQEDGYVIGMNSWGLDWGERGRFKLSHTDLGQLLYEEGDAFVILR